MRFIFINLIVSLSFIYCFPQQKDTIPLFSYEKQISVLFLQLNKTKDDSQKVVVNEKIAFTFQKALSNDSSFIYPFDSLKHMGKITSSDKKLRVYTWNLPFSDGTHKYYGFIQIPGGNDQKNLVIRLYDQSENLEDINKKVLTPDNWFGCLYYQVVVKKFKGETWYTLLGLDFNTLFSSKKIIDLFYISDAGIPVFGKPVFKVDNNLFTRVIFEFSARAGMTLKFEPGSDLILYDHLSPSKPSFTGKYQFYGPDFSYDALKFEDGFWTEVKDIDIRNINF